MCNDAAEKTKDSSGHDNNCVSMPAPVNGGSSNNRGATSTKKGGDFLMGDDFEMPSQSSYSQSSYAPT
jgi:hypothetical protein